MLSKPALAMPLLTLIGTGISMIVLIFAQLLIRLGYTAVTVSSRLCSAHNQKCNLVPCIRSLYPLQIDFPDNLQPCLELELLAMRHEWLMFDAKDKSGVSPGFTIPGYYYGLYFKRQQ